MGIKERYEIAKSEKGDDLFGPVLKKHTPLSSTLTPFFLIVPLQLSSQKKKLCLVKKHIWWGVKLLPLGAVPPNPTAQVTPSHAGFCWGSLKERGHLEDLGVCGRIILKLNLKEYYWRTWTEF
jgi:hypothetical protein